LAGLAVPWRKGRSACYFLLFSALYIAVTNTSVTCTLWWCILDNLYICGMVIWVVLVGWAVQATGRLWESTESNRWDPETRGSPRTCQTWHRTHQLYSAAT